MALIVKVRITTNLKQSVRVKDHLAAHKETHLQ